MIEIDLADGTRLRVDAFRQRARVAAGPVGVENDGVISFLPGTKVYLACEPVSMRLGFDGLTTKVISPGNYQTTFGLRTSSAGEISRAFVDRSRLLNLAVIFSGSSVYVLTL